MKNLTNLFLVMCLAVGITAVLNSCMAQPDAEAVNTSNVFVPDSDGDGWTPLSQDDLDKACVETAELALSLGDCDDTNPLTYPGAPEIFDGKDNDCDGKMAVGECKIGTDCGAGEVCVDNECTSDLCIGKDCDDANVCTDDTCDAGLCVHTANTVACDDGLYCTALDKCSAGVCAGTVATCDDNDACTTDSCDEVADSCTSAVIDCDDANICTDDSCDQATGLCVSTPNADPCDDSNACTTTDTCAAGACVGGPAPDCDDANLCTVDSCDPALGCINTAMTCNDGNLCTNDSCDPATGCINFVMTCDDANVCTTDACDPADGMCKFVWNSGCCFVDADCLGLQPAGYVYMQGAGWWHNFVTGFSFGCIEGTCGSCFDWDNDGACALKCLADADCDDANPGTVDTCAQNGYCSYCEKKCVGVECGGDGCGGSCGNCDEGSTCNAGICEPMAPAPQPEGTGDCGDGLDNDLDGLFDCGEPACNGAPCAAGKTCQGGLCKVTPPAQPVTFVTIEVVAPSSAEIWLFAASAVKYMLSPATFQLTESEACTGSYVSIAARTNSGSWPWWGCPLDPPTPSKSTLTIKVNGVVVPIVPFAGKDVAGDSFEQPINACGGLGEGNLILTKAQLGCK